jgi:DNA-binding PadR family transcriptional regulator
MYNKKLAKELGIDEAILFGSLCGYHTMFNGVEEFYCEQERIMEDTCLSEYRLQNALRNLKKEGLVSVVKKGMPAKNYYKLNEEKLMEVLHVTSDPKIRVTGDLNFNTTSDPKIDTTINNNNNNNINNNNNLYTYTYDSINLDADENVCQSKEIDEQIIEHPILTYWNQKNIIVHKPSAKINATIKKALKTFTEEQIKLYIDRYVKMVNDPNYYFDYKWTLEEFLTRKKGIYDFADDGLKWINYMRDQDKRSFKPKPKNRPISILDIDFGNNEGF